MTSKSELKRLCIQKECPYRDYLEAEIKKMVDTCHNCPTERENGRIWNKLYYAEKALEFYAELDSPLSDLAKGTLGITRA